MQEKCGFIREKAEDIILFYVIHRGVMAVLAKCARAIREAAKDAYWSTHEQRSWGGVTHMTAVYSWTASTPVAFGSALTCSHDISFPRIKKKRKRVYFDKGGITNRECLIILPIYAISKFGGYVGILPILMDRYKNICTIWIYCEPHVAGLELYIRPSTVFRPKIYTIPFSGDPNLYKITISDLELDTNYIWVAYYGNSPRECMGRTWALRIQSTKLFNWWRHQWATPKFPDNSNLWII